MLRPVQQRRLSNVRGRIDRRGMFTGAEGGDDLSDLGLDSLQRPHDLGDALAGDILEAAMSDSL